MKRIILIISSLVLFACDREASDEEASGLSDTALSHPNGLIMNRPVDFVESATHEGFIFKGPAMVRYRLEITVERQDTPPDVQGMSSERLGKDKAFYRIRKFSNGNGAPVYKFWAAKPSGNHWIVVETSEAEEFGTPGFGEAWFLLRTARLQ